MFEKKCLKESKDVCKVVSLCYGIKKYFKNVWMGGSITFCMKDLKIMKESVKKILLEGKQIKLFVRLSVSGT